MTPGTKVLRLCGQLVGMKSTSQMPPTEVKLQAHRGLCNRHNFFDDQMSIMAFRTRSQELRG